MDNLADILNEGIEAKRRGDYKRALELNLQAQKIDPFDFRCYNNIMKILIGLREYEVAFRNLLILCHFNIIHDMFSKDIMSELLFQQNLEKSICTSDKLTDEHNFEPKLIYEALKLDPRLKELIDRSDNLTFPIGHCFIGKLIKNDGNILKQFGIYSQYFDNYNTGVLGFQTGQDFRNSIYREFFLSIGFIYAHMNLNLSLQSKQEIVDYYIDSNTIIRNDIWNYRQFLFKTYVNENIEYDDTLETILIKNIVKKIEHKFNTKVYQYGVEKKGSDEFNNLAPLGIIPDWAIFLFWFLVPIDDADNVITNDYLRSYSILREDWDISSYLEQLFNLQVYDIGAKRVEKYEPNDNIVPNAEKIGDLRYRYFKFYTPELK